MAVQLCWYLAAALCLSSVCVYSERLVGGWSDMDPDNEIVQNVTKFALKSYNAQSNDMFTYKLIQIMSAQSQLVNGMNYAVILKIGRTYCTKNRSSHYGDGQACDVENSEVSEVYQCRFVIYSPTWNKGNDQLTSSSCEQK